MRAWSLCVGLLLCCACGPDAITECRSSHGARVICDLQNPEDLVRIPGTRQVVVSQFGSMSHEQAGALALLELDGEKVNTLYPQGGIGVEPTMHEGPDWGDASCPGPPDGRFNPHGIDLQKRDDGKLQLFVVNHGGREAVELFELLLDGAGRYQLQWRGCVPAPDGSFLNDVAALPGQGFVVTHMFPKSFGTSALYHMARAVLQLDTGYVLQWAPGKRLRKVAGSDAPFPNGIAATPDGSEIFVNAYMGNEVRHLALASGALLGAAAIAHPDNISWSDDGKLLVASHVGGLSQISACEDVERGACPAAFEIVSLDPQTLVMRTLVHREGAPMGAATVAIAVDRELLVGSFKSDRMLRIPR